MIDRTNAGPTTTFATPYGGVHEPLEAAPPVVAGSSCTWLTAIAKEIHYPHKVVFGLPVDEKGAQAIADYGEGAAHGSPQAQLCEQLKLAFAKPKPMLDLAQFPADFVADLPDSITPVLGRLDSLVLPKGLTTEPSWLKSHCPKTLTVQQFAGERFRCLNKSLACLNLEVGGALSNVDVYQGTTLNSLDKPLTVSSPNPFSPANCRLVRGTGLQPVKVTFYDLYLQPVSHMDYPNRLWVELPAAHLPDRFLANSGRFSAADGTTIFSPHIVDLFFKLQMASFATGRPLPELLLENFGTQQAALKATSAYMEQHSLAASECSDMSITSSNELGSHLAVAARRLEPGQTLGLRISARYTEPNPRKTSNHTVAALLRCDEAHNGQRYYKLSMYDPSGTTAVRSFSTDNPEKFAEVPPFILGNPEVPGKEHLWALVPQPGLTPAGWAASGMSSALGDVKTPELRRVALVTLAIANQPAARIARDWALELPKEDRPALLSAWEEAVWAGAGEAAADLAGAIHELHSAGQLPVALDAMLAAGAAKFVPGVQTPEMVQAFAQFLEPLRRSGALNSEEVLALFLGNSWRACSRSRLEEAAMRYDMVDVYRQTIARWSRQGLLSPPELPIQAARSC